MPIWFLTTKSQNHTEIFACRWCATYHWKAQSKVYIRSYGPPKCRKSQFWKLRDFQFGSPETNDIWMQPPWVITNNTIKGKVVATPKSGPWWVVWVCVCSWFFFAPKVLQLCTNQLVVWFCKSMWIVDPFFILHSPHLGAPTCPSYPWSVVS